jgi:hypothetical protein
MRYVSAILLGLAAAQGNGVLFQAIGAGICVGLGVITFAFAVEAIVRDGKE